MLVVNMANELTGTWTITRASTVRKLLFLLFCHVGVDTSQNLHT